MRRDMDSIDNNQYEVKPTNSKRKIIAPCPNAYLNPALDLLANEDRICNTAMEIIPHKKRKRSKSLDIISFENSGLDAGLRKATNEFLVREIDNVKRNVKMDLTRNNNSDVNTKTNTKSDHNDSLKVTDDINLTVDLTKTDITGAVNPVVNTIVSTATVTATVNPVVNTIDTVNPDFNNTVVSTATVTATVNPVVNTIDTVNPDFNNTVSNEPIYANIKTESQDETFNITDLSKIVNEDFDSGISVLEYRNNRTIETKNIYNYNKSNLSFIDRLALDSPSVTDSSLVLDDDLNESNIMEIKTITIITKRKIKNTNPFLDPNLEVNNFNLTNPFLDYNKENQIESSKFENDSIANETTNPFLDSKQNESPNSIIPRRLFTTDTNSTISFNDSYEHEYENVKQSHIYENIDELNKQSKVLGCDVSQFNKTDILNLNKETNEKKSKSVLKVGKLSKKMFKTLKKTFKQEKMANPYEVQRKVKVKNVKSESGIENPGLNLDNSDDLDIEELEEHQYETIKTIRNTQLNMNLTPLKVKDELDFSQKTNTPGKKVRFDSTLNREKVITGNSFDYDIQSPGFDAKIDKYHDELENCINERKFLQQNM